MQFLKMSLNSSSFAPDSENDIKTKTWSTSSGSVVSSSSPEIGTIPQKSSKSDHGKGLTFCQLTFPYIHLL